MPDVNETEFPPLPEYAANPFIAALPPIRTVQEIQRSFHCPPLLMEIDRKRPAEQRLHAVLRLLHYSQPTVTSRKVGLQIDQMMRQSYLGRDPSSTQWMRVANAFATREREESDKANRRARKGPVTADEVLGQLAPTKDTSMSCLVIGPPGMGKTHAARTTLAHYPQVIFHEAPIQVAQITWLRIECPPDGSLVSLCRFFFAAVDKALEEAGLSSNLHAQYKTAPMAVLLTGMARVANAHAIGIIVIDEVQHVKINRTEGNALLNFLVTLRNLIGVSMIMIGTMSALPVLQRTFRDARRADGIGSVNFNRMPPAPEPDEQGERADADVTEVKPIYGDEFHKFVSDMWRWQYTNVQTELTIEILNALYEETQGITDLIVKLFILCQMQLMTISAARAGFEEVITAELIHEVAEENLNTVRPFIQALRNNDHKALAKCEDLIDFSDWFISQVAGFGIPENKPVHDIDHGATRLPPMVSEGSIDRAVVDQLLEGMGIGVDEREIVMARHRKLIEAGDLAGLVVAVRENLDALAARGRLKKKPLKAAPPVEGDLRLKLDGVKAASAVVDALDAPDLEDALAE